MKLTLLAFTSCLSFVVSSIDTGGKIQRYLFYDVNPGEGFNLRRDVHVRMAVMVKNLNENSLKYKYTLVLPPWGPLYHWKSQHIGQQVRIPWKLFFDVYNMQLFAPVVDLEDFLLTAPNGWTLDAVYYLQGYAEGWTEGAFEEKIDFRDCLEANNRMNYRRSDQDGLFDGRFWQYPKQIRAKKFACVSVQGTTAIMAKFIEEMSDENRFVMLDRAETLLHEHFGDSDYWSARRSMRFSNSLVAIADEFRAEKLASADESDSTEVPDNWTDHKPDRGRARGGPYICAHLRRRDFVVSRKDHIPSIEGAARQLRRKMTSHNVTKVFVATDAPQEEFEQLCQLLPDREVFRYEAPGEVLSRFKDGGVAIIDQIICSRARYFIGSYESTFTFRIQEEREILGFGEEKTFDMLCKDGEDNCSRGSVWKIAYPPSDQYREEL